MKTWSAFSPHSSENAFSFLKKKSQIISNYGYILYVWFSSFQGTKTEKITRISGTCKALSKVPQGFPGGSVVAVPCQHSRSGVISGAGRSHVSWGNEAHVPWLLSVLSTACALQLLSPAHCRAHGPQQEALSLQLGSSPQNWRKACAAAKFSTTKNKVKFFKAQHIYYWGPRKEWAENV